MRVDLSRTNTWIFDLDNTLYPPNCRLEGAVVTQMICFTAGRFDISVDEARRMVSEYHVTYGATVIGYYKHHGIDPKSFLDAVYCDAPLETLDVWANSPELAEIRTRLAKLPGRRIIFTNGTRYHAERVLDYLGMAHLFDQIIDIKDGDYRPKPQSPMYQALMRADIDPATSIFVEDTAKNLPPAKALGMQTVLVNRPDAVGSDGIDTISPSLLDWLRTVTD